MAQRTRSESIALSIGFSELVRSVILRLHFHRLFLDCYNSIVDYGARLPHFDTVVRFASLERLNHHGAFGAEPFFKRQLFSIRPSLSEKEENQGTFVFRLTRLPPAPLRLQSRS